MSCPHICSQCEHIRRTSPCQVFLKCEFWSDSNLRDASEYVPDEWRDSVQTYIVLHCHVQPEAEACLAFRLRRNAA